MSLLTFPRTVVPLVAALLCTSGCGDGALNQQDAARAFASVLTLSQQVGLAATESCTSCVTYQSDGALECPGGGQVFFTGDASDGEPISMHLSLQYNSCTDASGIILDGNIAYSSTIGVDNNFTYDMHGLLDFAGAIEGSCVLQLSLHQSADSYQASGDLCGRTFTYP